MSALPDLLFAPLARTEQRELPLTGLEARYWRWRRTEDGGYAFGYFLRAARARAAGGGPVRVKQIVEQYRQERCRSIDNSFVAPLARELVDVDPSLRPWIEFRRRAG